MPAIKTPWGVGLGCSGVGGQLCVSLHVSPPNPVPSPRMWAGRSLDGSGAGGREEFPFSSLLLLTSTATGFIFWGHGQKEQISPSRSRVRV